MIARRLSVVVLAVVACLAWMGCRPAVQPPLVKNQKGCLPAQKRGNSNVMQFKMDDDSFRMRLLMVELVQRDIRLTADQIGKLRILYDTHRARSRELHAELLDIFPPSQSFPQGEFEARMQKFRALSEDLKSNNKEFRTKGLAMLTPSQTERLKQIQLQTTIPEALTRPEIIKVLNISEEQCTKIRTLRDQMHQKQLDGFSDLNFEHEERLIEFMKKSYGVQVEATSRILDILTPEQRTELEKLTGKTIEVTRLYDALIREDTEFSTCPAPDDTGKK